MAKECSTNMGDQVPQALTIVEMARQAGCEKHQVQHFITTRHIPESSRAGRIGIFNLDTLAKVKRHIQELSDRKAAMAG